MARVNDILLPYFQRGETRITYIARETGKDKGYVSRQFKLYREILLANPEATSFNIVREVVADIKHSPRIESRRRLSQKVQQAHVLKALALIDSAMREENKRLYMKECIRRPLLAFLERIDKGEVLNPAEFALFKELNSSYATYALDDSKRIGHFTADERRKLFEPRDVTIEVDSSEPTP